MRAKWVWICASVMGVVAAPATLHAQLYPVGTAFGYQGQLKESGSPYSGDTAQMTFDLYDRPAGGTLLGSVGPLSVPVTDGLFTVSLDFGGGVFTGEARWLEIVVNGTTLSPRQELTPTPYALALPGLWTQQNATSPNLIGGYSGNSADPSADGATISGGGANGTENSALDNAATVGGGSGNQAGSDDGNPLTAGSATVGGGYANTADATAATVAGGQWNNANAIEATVGGGLNNTASGPYATVPGGRSNSASGDYSLAAGRLARAIHAGSFVWGDSTSDYCTSTGVDQFLIQAAGGVGIGTTSPATALDVAGTVTAGAFVGDGSGLTGLPSSLWEISGSDIYYDTGNVGIGTSTPSEALDVLGNVAVSGTVDGVDISSHAADPNAHHTPPTTLPPSGPAGGDLSGSYPNPSVLDDSHEHGDSTVADDISVDNGRLFAPAGSGNVGIGTDAPEQTLHIFGPDAALKLQNDDVGGYTLLDEYWSQLRINKVTNSGLTLLDVSPVPLDGVSSAKLRFFRDTNTTGVKSVLFLRGDGTPTADAQIGVDGENSYLQANGGNVGIGTSTPSEVLDVVGNVQATGTLTSGSSITIDGTPGAEKIDSTADLELHVSSARALRIEADPTSPNLIGGYSGNSVEPGAIGATIGGGGAEDNGFGIPAMNRVVDDYGTVGGGFFNEAGGGSASTTDRTHATVSGGYGNKAYGYCAVVSGGISNRAAGYESAVGGGGSNYADGAWSTICGGSFNAAGGDYSFAAGRRAKVRDPAEVGGGDPDGDEGSFVFADSTDADFISTGPNQFLIRASGGVGIGTNDPNALLNGLLTVAGAIQSTVDGFRFPDGTLQTTAAVSGASTLDEAYDGGGAGAGRTITADAGPVEILGPDGLTVASAITSGSSITIDGTPGSEKITSSGSGLELYLGSRGGLRIDFGPPGNVNIIAGYQENAMTDVGVYAATIAGGGEPFHPNLVDTGSTVGGGRNNTAGSDDGEPSNAWCATVPGGRDNTALGDYSFAAGRRAQANHDGAFVWADSTDADFASTGEDQFLIRASGGVAITTNTTGGFDLAVGGTAAKPGGGPWSVYSDRRLKKNIASLEGTLERLLRLRGVSFEHKDPEFKFGLPGRQIGMVAQEVEQVFPEWVGEDTDGYKYIAVSGFEALTVEALRELREEKDNQLREKDAQIAELSRENAAIEARLAKLELLLRQSTADQIGGAR